MWYTHARTHTHTRDLQSYIKILLFIIYKLLYVLVVQEIKMKLSQVSSYRSRFINILADKIQFTKMMMRFTSHTIMTNAQLISQLRTESYDKTIIADFIYQYVSSLAKGLMIYSSLLERNRS